MHTGEVYCDREDRMVDLEEDPEHLEFCSCCAEEVYIRDMAIEDMDYNEWLDSRGGI